MIGFSIKKKGRPPTSKAGNEENQKVSDEMKKETRGGARPNAGRKRHGEEAKRTTVSFVCTPSEKEKLKELASLSGLSQSQFICKKLFS